MITAQALALLIVARSLAHMVVVVVAANQDGVAGFVGRLVSALAMAAFGLVLRRPLDPSEPPAMA